MDITLKAPADTSSVSVGGSEYFVKRGKLSVPDRHVPDLIAQGFDYADPSDAPVDTAAPVAAATPAVSGA
ncbi:MAG: hypothetical protein JO253_03615 [Alphaproteobacteria bacterium]|nr:hypothetical protein [Alphaproteobacteria bacterium]